MEELLASMDRHEGAAFGLGFLSIILLVIIGLIIEHSIIAIRRKYK